MRSSPLVSSKMNCSVTEMNFYLPNQWRCSFPTGKHSNGSLGKIKTKQNKTEQTLSYKQARRESTDAAILETLSTGIIYVHSYTLRRQSLWLLWVAFTGKYRYVFAWLW